MRPMSRKRPKFGVLSETDRSDLSPDGPDDEVEVEADVGPDFDPDPDADPVFDPDLERVGSRSALDDVAASAGSRTGIGGFIDSYRS
jgi:hypothetical protein